MKIIRVYNTHLNLNNTLDFKEKYFNIEIQTEGEGDNYIQNIYILSSKTFQRVELGIKTILTNYDKIFLTVFVKNPVEDNSDLNVVEVVGGKNIDSVSITTIDVKTYKQSVEYKTGYIKTGPSNLCLPRSKVSVAKWSTANKNQLSNYLKTSEAIHSVFEGIIYKNNEAILKYFSKDLVQQEYKRVFVEDLNIQEISEIASSIKEYRNNPRTILETSYLNNGFKKIQQISNEDISYFKIIYDKYSQKSIVLQNNLGSIFIKNIDRDATKDVEAIIYGRDYDDEVISEKLTVRVKMYTKSFSVFKSISKIVCDQDVIVCNYLDSFMSHIYHIPKIARPIVNNNLVNTCPVVSICKSDNKNTGIVFSDYYSGDTFLKFDFLSQVYDFFIDYQNNVVWTSYEKGNYFLNIGNLYIDYSKNTYNDITINSGGVIELSDENTLVGSWLSVEIDVPYFLESNLKQDCLIRCVNNDTIYYYDPTNKSLSKDKVFINKSHTNSKPVKFEVLVENHQPYIISILSDSLILSAMSHSNALVATKTTKIDSPNFIVTGNNTISIYDTVLSTVNPLDYKEPGHLVVILKSKDVKQYQYKLVVGNYSIKDLSENSDAMYEKYNLVGEDLKIIVIDKNKIGPTNTIYLSTHNSELSQVERKRGKLEVYIVDQENYKTVSKNILETEQIESICQIENGTILE